MSELSRDEQLVRAGKAREAVMGFLNTHGDGVTPVTQDVIAPAVASLEVTPVELGQMLYRMAHDGLIAKHAVEHERYRVGYTSNPPEGLRAEAAEPKRKYARKPATESAPIDVRVNEREGIITIRYAGMVLSFSREGT